MEVSAVPISLPRNSSNSALKMLKENTSLFCRGCRQGQYLLPISNCHWTDLLIIVNHIALSLESPVGQMAHFLPLKDTGDLGHHYSAYGPDLFIEFKFHQPLWLDLNPYPQGREPDPQDYESIDITTWPPSSHSFLGWRILNHKKEEHSPNLTRSRMADPWSI